jgi:RNA polymerase sigma factor (sigma-70 family)
VTSHVNRAAESAVNGYVIMAVSDPLSDAAAFEWVIRVESGALFAVAFSILRDVQEAEDAVQETMERAWKNWSTLREPSSRSAWLRQICVRRAIDMRRRVLPRLWMADHTDADRWIEEQPDPDLDRIFRRLTRRQRAVVALHYHYGYSLDECAQMIGSAPGTVRSHLARALATMRKELGYERF